MLTAEKCDWLSDGARKPVLAAPRKMNCCVGEARGELAVGRAAEVAEVLERGRRTPTRSFVEDVAFEIDVDGLAVARRVDLVRGPEAGEHLRARGRAAAELVAHAAVDVRVRLAGLDAGSPRCGTRRPKATFSGPASPAWNSARVEVARQLVVAERARVEAGLVRRSSVRARC